ncbi:hypothetical protein M427DRAFT_271655 [Gonapodya prolifera JEL478]|uniref:C2H2-type domain-containing protein n=1 Tax=Gonapodya prolifera (strain JEL478) TaxID=1344416 RepID=A0A139AXM0_GONPJ|nr:hypothetical protein M427DRAFT_271655 [Gonapodya prolifera JEL478]|eukprot:KXS21492.1 hypothetical protein M427DRAFT_271655 [Gonapodya prolifera JEL478]
MVVQLSRACASSLRLTAWLLAVVWWTIPDTPSRGITVFYCTPSSSKTLCHSTRWQLVVGFPSVFPPPLRLPFPTSISNSLLLPFHLAPPSSSTLHSQLPTPNSSHSASLRLPLPHSIPNSQLLTPSSPPRTAFRVGGFWCQSKSCAHNVFGAHNFGYLHL